MILIVNICKEKLHYYEFVKPIEDVVKETNECRVKSYKTVEEKDFKEAEKIIISGTSLQDNEFLKNIKSFDWIRDYGKPILGICGGMQIIGAIFNGQLRKKPEIGFYFENFKKSFLGLSGRQEVYHLHNFYITIPENFINYAGKIPQAIRHKNKEVYACLFHPEVRQKDLIRNFCKYKGEKR